MAKRFGLLARMAAAGGLFALSAGCSTTDWEAVANGLNMAAEEIAVTAAQVEPYGCGYNHQRQPVCDDTGDGFADRYAHPAYDVIPGAPLVRTNAYGEAYQYDGGCDCWRREPSLDSYPR